MKMKKKIIFGILIVITSLWLTGRSEFSKRDTVKANEPEASVKLIITKDNYKNWSVDNLREAQDDVGKFLKEQQFIPSEDKKRPYKNNEEWSEGSLQALDKAYESSIVVLDDKKTSSDLTRQLLIESVRNLQRKKNIAEGIPQHLVLNNYPNDSFSYDIEFKIPKTEVEPKPYDVVFSVDFSYSMEMRNVLGMYAKPREVSREMIKTLAKKLLNENSNSRVRLLGYNSSKSNALPINVQIDTGFIDVTSDYNKIIDDAYKPAIGYKNDYIPEFIKDSAKKIKNDARKDATPVLIMISDYEQSITPNDRLYLETLDAFKELDETLNPLNGFSIPVLMDHGGGLQNTMKEKMPSIVSQYKGWDWLQVKNTTIEGATEQLKDKMGTVYTEKYLAALSSDRFNFNRDSFVSDTATIWDAGIDMLLFKGPLDRDSIGSYKVDYDKSKNSNNQLGDMAEVTKQNNVDFNGEVKDFNDKLPVFLPYTDAAIELYTYKGSGSESDSSSYNLNKTIMGSHYNSYGGQEYEYTSSELSGLLYGTQLFKNDALAIVKETLKDEFNKWDFNITANPTAASHTMTFDAAKNVYKVYGKIKMGIVNIHYQNELLKPIAEDKQIQGSVGESYSELPIEIEGYKYNRVNGNPTGSITENPQTVTFIYQDNQFDLLQEVHNMDGEIANEVSAGEELLYTVTLKSNFNHSSREVFYKELNINEMLDPSLEKIEDIKITLSNGSNVGSGMYDIGSNTIKGLVTEADQVVLSENVILSYHATVKETATKGTEIKEKAKATASYTNGIISAEKESNEVVSIVIDGELIFESAPSLLDFGEAIKISSKEEVYPIKIKEGNLSVKDLRGNGKQWSMTAKMLKLLTKNDGNILTDGLYYRYKGNEQLMGLENSVLIYDKTTSSTNSIIISDEWIDELTEPMIKVKPGQARKGVYSGVIQWTLQDVPSAFLSSNSDIGTEE